MVVRMLSFIALISLAGSASAQPDEAPRGPAPNMWLASAIREKGKVVVKLAHPVEQGNNGPLVRREGIGSLPPGTLMRWLEFSKRMPVGEKIFAFRADGKKLDSEAVLKALTKPQGAAVFVLSDQAKSTAPSPFYLSLLHPDTPVLMVNKRDLYPSEP